MVISNYSRTKYTKRNLFCLLGSRTKMTHEYHETQLIHARRSYSFFNHTVLLSIVGDHCHSTQNGVLSQLYSPCSDSAHRSSRTRSFQKTPLQSCRGISCWLIHRRQLLRNTMDVSSSNQDFATRYTYHCSLWCKETRQGLKCFGIVDIVTKLWNYDRFVGNVKINVADRQQILVHSTTFPNDQH